MSSELRPLILQARAQLEADGLKVADDGSLIAWPATPATGYLVEVGGVPVNVEADGSFALPGAVAGATGRIYHLSDSRLTFNFDASRLGQNPAQIRTLILRLPFQGGCFMNAEDICGSVVSQRISLENLRVMAREAQPTLITLGPRGTYPGRLGQQITCEDKNGFLSSPSLPNEIRYLGSTCDKYVRAGACPNENFMSDIQYNLILAGNLAPGRLLDSLSGVFGGEILSPPLVPTSVLQCVDNHKGRVCQQVKIGDLSVDLKPAGKLVKPDPDGAPGFDFDVVTVFPGQKLPVVVHNNGNYGITVRKRLESEIGGVMTPGFATSQVRTLSANIPVPVPQLPGVGSPLSVRSIVAGGVNIKVVPISIDEILHYDPPASGTLLQYKVDRDFVYEVPSTASAGQVDTFLYYVDGSYAVARFVVGGGTAPTPTPSTSPGSVNVLPMTNLSFVHQVGVTNCPQLIGTYTISNDKPLPVNFSVSGVPSQLTVTPTSGSISSGASQTLQVFFNCSTTSSFGPVQFQVQVDGQNFTGGASGTVQ